MRTAAVAIFVVAMVLGAQAQSYQHCGLGEPCPEGECCTLSGNRYARPTCTSLRASGEPCRPNAQPQNYTLYVDGPFGSATAFTDVFWVVCPCKSGLECDAGTCA